MEFNGEADHVHLLANLPPRVAAPGLVRSHTGASSRKLSQELPNLVRHADTAPVVRLALRRVGQIG
ncbi:transposase [Kitasatospora sp. NPDC054939]